MLIEQELENTFITEFQKLNLEDIQIFAANGVSHVEEKNVSTVVVVNSSMRANDNFSLPMITIPIVISIVTRIEQDPEKTKHTEIVEKILRQLSLWHKFSNVFGTVFETDQFLSGELTLTGGDISLDQNQKIWATTITCSVRGSEKFSEDF